MDYYVYYKNEFKGILPQIEFEALQNKVVDFLKSYVDDKLTSDRVQDSLENYGDMQKAICYEIDYIAQNGGVNALNGSSDLDLKQVQSSGYTFQVDNAGNVYKGVPLSPLSETLIMNELKKNGYLSMGWNW